MSLMRLGGILQPALARTTSAMASTRSAVAVRVHPAVGRAVQISQEAASLVSVLFLNPGAMVALVFGLWRLGSDLGFAGPFVVSEGLFSHWLVWIMLSAGLKALATMATRNALGEKTQQSASGTDVARS
jgi:hypothetical protein